MPPRLSGYNTRQRCTQPCQCLSTKAINQNPILFLYNHRRRPHPRIDSRPSDKA